MTPSSVEMIPKSAIEKAVQGGYPALNLELVDIELERELVLDPAFWSSLGKVLGWQKQPYLCPDCRTIGYRDGNHMIVCDIKIRYGNWDDEAKRFYELILTGGNVNKFWEEILI